jgi:curved DNA-binding protein CbpA
MTSEQAFDILGIRDHNIDEASLKKAFYSAARRTHPDSNPEDETADAKFQLISEAYDVLCDYLKLESSAKQSSAEFTAYKEWKTGGTEGTGRTFGKKPTGTSKSSSARRTGGASKASSAGRKASGTSKKTSEGSRTGGASDASSFYERKTGSTANASSFFTGAKTSDTENAAAAGRRTRRNSSSYSEKDVWKAYNEADIKFAKQRHEDASEKAAETIRNHMKMETEQAAQEARREQEEREKRIREEVERLRREEQEARQEQHAGARGRETIASFQKTGGVFFRLWHTHITSNQRLKRSVFGLLLLFLILWADAKIIGVTGSIAYLTNILAIIAKWGLIVWISEKITVVVHKNWKNRVLSTFAFMVSMELLIILMNWLEEVVQKIL